MKGCFSIASPTFKLRQHGSIPVYLSSRFIYSDFSYQCRKTKYSKKFTRIGILVPAQWTSTHNKATHAHHIHNPSSLMHRLVRFIQSTSSLNVFKLLKSSPWSQHVHVVVSHSLQTNNFVTHHMTANRRPHKRWILREHTIGMTLINHNHPTSSSWPHLTTQFPSPRPYLINVIYVQSFHEAKSLL